MGYGYLINKELLDIPYFFLIIGVTVLVIPIVLTFFQSRAKIFHMLKTGVFFTVTALLHEIVSLELNHWYFPAHGEFIGFVPFFGHTIPVEELLFWIILMSFGILSFFEYFEED